ncbi:hypothetical protein [Bradyrhizobium sp. USDA 10063]
MNFGRIRFAFKARLSGLAPWEQQSLGSHFFGESANLGRLSAFLLVVIGLIGLMLFSEYHHRHDYV